ncbi:MAG: hypothetical protein ABIJ40_12810, partial [Bacteroidota bacterium]
KEVDKTNGYKLIKTIHLWLLVAAMLTGVGVSIGYNNSQINENSRQINKLEDRVNTMEVQLNNIERNTDIINMNVQVLMKKVGANYIVPQKREK